MSVTVQVDARSALSRLDRLIIESRDRTQPNRQLSVQLYGWTQRAFREGGASQTPSWAPLATSTAKRKAQQGYSSLPLVRTGHYRQSFRPFYDNDRAGVGSEVPYSKYHEAGTRKMPARPALPSERVATDYAVQIYQRWAANLAR